MGLKIGTASTKTNVVWFGGCCFLGALGLGQDLKPNKLLKSCHLDILLKILMQPLLRHHDHHFLTMSICKTFLVLLPKELHGDCKPALTTPVPKFHASSAILPTKPKIFFRSSWWVGKLCKTPPFCSRLFSPRFPGLRWHWPKWGWRCFEPQSYPQPPATAGQQQIDESRSPGVVSVS